MNKIFVIINIILLLSCSACKVKHKAERVPLQFGDVYYITFTFFPENTHPMTMNGIGKSFEIDILRKDNVQDFIESFYQQFTYTPILFLQGYWDVLDCLGLNKELNMELYFKNYYINYTTSDILEEYELDLDDGKVIDIKLYKLPTNLTVKYIKDYKNCLMSSSIELDINEIKTIDKIAVLLNKDDCHK